VSQPYLTLFGIPSLAVNGQILQEPASHRKDMALLAFLVLDPGPHTRDELASLLWADSSDGRARGSLRQSLKRLRKALGEGLAADRSTVEVVGEISCDASDFLNMSKANAVRAAEYDVPRFLAGFRVAHAPGFYEWLDSRRRQFLKCYLDVLLTLARTAMMQWRWREAADWADRVLEADPLSDEAARVAVEGWYMAGDRGRALARFSDHERHMVEELGSQPSEALRGLKAQVEKDVGSLPQRPVSREWSVRPPSLDAPLVGRDAQWESLANVWQSVARGTGAVALIEGDIGSGKTRLAGDFARWCRAQGATVLASRGTGGVTGISYGPVAQALADAVDAPGLLGTSPEWLTEVARLLPELRERVPSLPPPVEPLDDTAQRRLFQGVAQLVLALAAEHPVVLLFDDLESYDQESCGLVDFLAPALADAPVLLVATYSLGVADRAAAPTRLWRAWRSHATTTMVSLASLAEDEVARLILEMGRLTSPDLGRRFRRRVFEVTGGNPFYINELLKGLFDQGVLTTASKSSEWVVNSGKCPEEFEMPTTLRRAIARRLEWLPYDMRDLLAVVAVSKAPCEAATISQVNRIPRVQAATLGDELVERNLLAVQSGGYLISHPLIADVVRRDLSQARLTELHRALALALEDGVSVDSTSLAARVARHASRGELPELACANAVLAAQDAMQHLACGEVIGWLELAEAQGNCGAGREIERLRGQVMELIGAVQSTSLDTQYDSLIQRLDREDIDLRQGP